MIRTSIFTFMERIAKNPNIFHLLLGERSGNSSTFQAAIAREIQYFIAELTDYIDLENKVPGYLTEE